MFSTSPFRRAAAGVLSASAGVALVLGTGVVGASAATAPAADTTAASTCTFGQHLRAAWAKAPDQLKADLKAARALPAGTEREAALKKIRDTALDGGYGDATKVRAEYLAAHHDGARLRPLPDALKSDLAALKGTSRADKVKGLEAIADKAVAGDYGATVQSFAKVVQTSDGWRDCTPSGS